MREEWKVTLKKFGFSIQVDIHGMTVQQAKRELERLLNTCGNDVNEIEVIHGYTGGQALLNLVRKDLKHKRIGGRILSLNQGVTVLKVKPREKA